MWQRTQPSLSCRRHEETPLLGFCHHLPSHKKPREASPAAYCIRCQSGVLRGDPLAGTGPPPSWIFPGNLSSGCTKLLAVLQMCWAYSHFGFLYFWCLPPLSAQKPFFLDKTSLNTYDGSSFHLYLVCFYCFIVAQKIP